MLDNANILLKPPENHYCFHVVVSKDTSEDPNKAQQPFKAVLCSSTIENDLSQVIATSGRDVSIEGALQSLLHVLAVVLEQRKAKVLLPIPDGKKVKIEGHGNVSGGSIRRAHVP